MQEATSFISCFAESARRHGGLPRRMPLGFSGGFTSNGMPFLFTVMCALSSAISASLPRMPFANTSTSSR